MLQVHKSEQDPAARAGSHTTVFKFREPPISAECWQSLHAISECLGLKNAIDGNPPSLCSYGMPDESRSHKQTETSADNPLAKFGLKDRIPGRNLLQVEEGAEQGVCCVDNDGDLDPPRMKVESPLHLR